MMSRGSPSAMVPVQLLSSQGTHALDLQVMSVAAQLLGVPGDGVLPDMLHLCRRLRQDVSHSGARNQLAAVLSACKREPLG